MTEKTDHRYKLLEMSTHGWTIFEGKAENLTRDECNAMMRQALDNGVSPERLSVVRQEDTRFDEGNLGKSI